MGDQVDNVFPLNSEILSTANILLSLKTSFYHSHFQNKNIFVTIGGSRGAWGTHAPPWASKFFRFHAVFGKIWRVHAPPGGFTPPPRENPGSATGYLFQMNCINEIYDAERTIIFGLIFNNWYIDFGKTLRPNHHTNHYFFSKLNGIIHCYDMVERKGYLIPKLTILTWRMYYEPLNNNNFIFDNIKLYLLNKLKKQINNWIFQVFKGIFTIKWLDFKW